MHGGCLKAAPNANNPHCAIPILQKTSDAKFADYVPHTAFFFPGQGAQTIGMAKVLRDQTRSLPNFLSTFPSAHTHTEGDTLDVIEMT